MEIKTQPAYYAVIPADVRYAEIPPNAKLLYGEITALCNKEGYCWATNSYFATLYRVAPTTISEWVKNLKDHGFIDCEIIDKTKRKIFLTLREIPKPLSGKAEADPSGNPEHINTSINTTKNKLSSFEKFWTLYPKKVEKKKTEARWNRLPEKIRLVILQDLPKRRETDQWKRGYTPNPMTYLNGERWNDEITAGPQKFGQAMQTGGREMPNWTQERIKKEAADRRAAMDKSQRETADKQIDQLKTMKQAKPIGH